MMKQVPCIVLPCAVGKCARLQDSLVLELQCFGRTVCLGNRYPETNKQSNLTNAMHLQSKPNAQLGKCR